MQHRVGVGNFKRVARQIGLDEHLFDDTIPDQHRVTPGTLAKAKLLFLDQHAHADQITFIPDGNGDFTRGMGMLVEKQDLGFGERSWRYSMLVRDGVIEKMFIEADLPGDPFEVSDAETMLHYVAPQAELPLDVTVFSREGCPFCVKAKGLLRDAGIEFDELVLNRDFAESTIRAVSGHSTVPQVFINGSLIGGSDALESYLGNAEAA